LEADQAELINLNERQARGQKLATELQHIEQELPQLARSEQQTIQGQQGIAHAATFR
jgi:hypothetical protein